MIFLLKYWRIGVVAIGVVAIIAFYFHYQGLRSELRETRTENARLVDINEQNKAVMDRLIQDHQKTLDEIDREHERSLEEYQRLEDISNDISELEDGPLAPIMVGLFDRLRQSENDH